MENEIYRIRLRFGVVVGINCDGCRSDLRPGEIFWVDLDGKTYEETCARGMRMLENAYSIQGQAIIEEFNELSVS